MDMPAVTNGAILGNEEIISDILTQIYEFSHEEAQLDGSSSLLDKSEQSYLNKEDKKYTRWKEQMDNWGYTWEAHEVTTEDGYILTIFRITGTTASGDFTPTKGSVLI